MRVRVSPYNSVGLRKGNFETECGVSTTFTMTPSDFSSLGANIGVIDTSSTTLFDEDVGMDFIYDPSQATSEFYIAITLEYTIGGSTSVFT